MLALNLLMKGENLPLRVRERCVGGRGGDLRRVGVRQGGGCERADEEAEAVNVQLRWVHVHLLVLLSSADGLKRKQNRVRPALVFCQAGTMKNKKTRE